MKFSYVKRSNLRNTLDLPVGISYDPMPSQKLHWAIWIVGYPNPICKEVLPFRRLATSHNVHTPNLDTDPLMIKKLIVSHLFACEFTQSC